MNLARICLIATLLLTFDEAARTQDSSKAILVDEFGTIGCEALSGRLDMFIAESRAKPDFQGYILISSTADVDPRLAWREKFIDGYPRYRQFEEDRALLLRGILPIGIQTQFRLGPAKSRLPVQNSYEPSFTLPRYVKKLRLHADFHAQGSCYMGPPLRILSKYLKADEGLDANIVIGTTTLKKFRALKKTIVQSFEANYRVDSVRLKFFRSKTQYDNVGYELWLIRRRTK